MTREQTIEAIKVMQAYVDGEKVEYQIRGGHWVAAMPPNWNWPNTQYRIKPTPVLRSWTADEVPLGAWMRTGPNGEYRWLIDTSGHNIKRKEWLESCEHSTDGGKTWSACGVVEEAK